MNDDNNRILRDMQGDINFIAFKIAHISSKQAITENRDKIKDIAAKMCKLNSSAISYPLSREYLKNEPYPGVIIGSDRDNADNIIDGLVNKALFCDYLIRVAKKRGDLKP